MYSDNERSWLTTKEAAELLRCTSRHITNLIIKGRLIAKKDDDGRYYIEKCDFFRAYPTAMKRERDRSIKNSGENNELELLQLEIDHLRQILDEKEKLNHEKSKQNEFLKEQLNNFTGEKAKMLDAINSHTRLLEHKESVIINHVTQKKRFNLRSLFKRN